MDPFLEAAIPNIVAQLRRQGYEEEANALEAWARSGGSTQLAPTVLMLAEPYARQQGTTLTGKPQPGMPTEQGQRVPGVQATAASTDTGTLGIGRGPSTGARAMQTVVPPAGALPGGPAVPPSVIPSQSGGPNDPDNPFRQGPQMPATNPTRPSASPTTLTDVPPSTGPGSGSKYSPGAAGQLLDDNDILAQFAMRAAGFDPSVITSGSKSAANRLIPMISAYRNAFGANQGTEGNIEGLPDFLKGVAQQYTTPGASFYGNARKYAQDLLGGSGMGDFLGNVGEQNEQFQFLQSLAPLLMGGANPMVQQSIGDQLEDLFGDYRYDENFGPNQEPGRDRTLRTFLKNRSDLSPAIRSLFGPLLR